MSSTKKPLRELTRLVKAGSQLSVDGGRPVNPPVVRASTVLFDSVAALDAVRERRRTERLFTYGARGTPTGFALEDAVCELEGGYRTRLFCSGLAAISAVMTSYLKPGDHVLINDSVYQPVRNLVNGVLARFGIRATFMRADGADMLDHLEPATKMVYLECPGSLVYELCDLSRLSALAHERGALVVADNTWGSGLQYRPLALGADVSIMAATKYLGGHSDVMMGTVTTLRDAWQPLFETAELTGACVSADDAYLVLRGMRSLAARLALHEHHALQVARWLETHPQVARVFCPALPSHQDHALFERDFTGTNGLVSFEFRHADTAAAARFVDALKYFGIGASWGGVESLATIANMKSTRSVADWSSAGAIVRLHIGLEDPRDLIDDLDHAFDTISA